MKRCEPHTSFGGVQLYARLRWLIHTAAVVLLGVATVANAGHIDPPTPASPTVPIGTPPTVPPTEPAVTPPPADPVAPLTLEGDVSDSIVVYCTLPRAAAEPHFKLFTERSFIKVSAVYESELENTSPGALADRLRRQHQAGKPQADLLWTDEIIETLTLAKEGVFRKYESESAVRHAGPNATEWPAELRGADGMWYGFSRRLHVLAYNPDVIGADPLPSSLTDLIDPRWRGQVALAKPVRGSDALHRLAVCRAERGADEFASFLKQLAHNAPKVVDDEAAVVREVASGRCRLGLTTSDAVIQMAVSGRPIRMRVLVGDRILAGGKVEGQTLWFHPGRSQLVGSLAIIAGGTNADTAEVLFDYLLSNEVAHVMEHGPAHSFRIGEQTNDGFARWCDGAVGPTRSRRMAVSVTGLTYDNLPEQAQAASLAWEQAFSANSSPDKP